MSEMTIASKEREVLSLGLADYLFAVTLSGAW